MLYSSSNFSNSSSTSKSKVERLHAEQEQQFRNMEIARIILLQLGGNRFKRMTGASNFSSITNGLSFKIPRTTTFTNVSYVEIILNDKDTYDMKFKRIWGSKVEDISEASDVYNNQLQATFTRNTGLATHL